MHYISYSECEAIGFGSGSRRLRVDNCFDYYGESGANDESKPSSNIY